MADAPSTAVLSVGYDLPALLEGAPAVHTFPEALERDDVDGAAQVIDDALRESPYALVIYPQWLREPTLSRLETIRAALNTDRLALHGSTLPPLAGGVLCNLASAMTAQLTRSGQLVAALDDLTRKLVVVSWLGTVSGLKEPSPSVWQHLGSVSPRSAFAVVLQPERSVMRIGKQMLGLQPASEPMVLAVSAQSGANGDWMAQAVGPALGGIPVHALPATRHGADWWGTTRVTEGVAFPTAIGDLTRELTARHRMRLCAWCSRAIASTPCPFCRGVAAPTEPAAAADRASPAA